MGINLYFQYILIYFQSPLWFLELLQYLVLNLLCFFQQPLLYVHSHGAFHMVWRNFLEKRWEFLPPEEFVGIAVVFHLTAINTRTQLWGWKQVSFHSADITTKTYVIHIPNDLKAPWTELQEFGKIELYRTTILKVLLENLWSLANVLSKSCPRTTFVYIVSPLNQLLNIWTYVCK